MSPQRPERKPESAGQKIGAFILAAILVFAFAALIHHASSTCPEARNPATQQCKVTP